MQRTEKYFEQDAFRTQCESTILAAEPDEKTGGGRIALDGTVFYPEGGGQPADRGTLTLPDGTTLNVTDVHEHDGILWHSVDALPESAVPGTAVSGCIDWEWRFDKMQQHTGEHILSGILHQMFGAENVGFHIGSEAVRMDTSVPISAEGLQAAELAANRIVWQDVPVLVSYPTREELAALVYRSKKEIEGQVRIVTIPGADVCACCGTHVEYTGEIRLVKLLGIQNYKGGVRISMLTGKDAIDDYEKKHATIQEATHLLSVKPDQVDSGIRKLLDANNYVIGNVDATVIAQRPKLAPYIDAMRENIAARLQIDKNQVNVKATTEEGLGFTGQGQGISSQAICLLETIDNFDYRSSRVVDDTVENAANPCMGCMGCAKR